MSKVVDIRVWNAANWSDRYTQETIRVLWDIPADDWQHYLVEETRNSSLYRSHLLQWRSDDHGARSVGTCGDLVTLLQVSVVVYPQSASDPWGASWLLNLSSDRPSRMILFVEGEAARDSLQVGFQYSFSWWFRSDSIADSFI